MKYCEKLLDKLAFLFNDLTEGDNYKCIIIYNKS